MKQLCWMLGLLVVLAACKKSSSPANPFDDPKNRPPVTNNNDTLLPLDNFAGLHQRIFKPTCSNSGCHDGTFEPDFRTIESSYSTLVYQPVIKNNQAGAFQFRVVPGNANSSVLHERVVRDIDGISGIMPLSVDPNSDWPDKKTDYIAAIVAWINGGARDMFGNPPTNGPVNPRISGWQLQGRELQLQFMGGVPDAVLLLGQEGHQKWILPVRPLPVAEPGQNVFGEKLPFTHVAELPALPKGSYELVNLKAQQPALYNLQNAFRFEIR